MSATYGGYPQAADLARALDLKAAAEHMAQLATRLRTSAPSLSMRLSGLAREAELAAQKQKVTK